MIRQSQLGQKTVDSEAILFAIELNLVNSSWRVSGKFACHSLVCFVTYMILAKAYRDAEWQNFWLTLIYKNKKKKAKFAIWIDFFPSSIINMLQYNNNNLEHKHQLNLETCKIIWFFSFHFFFLFFSQSCKKQQNSILKMISFLIKSFHETF